MGDSKNKITKGVKIIACALPLMILGPVILTIGFRALNDGIYVWVILGALLIFGAIIIAFKGIKTILNGLFEKDAK
jgi:hypothetical protein